MTVLNTAGAVRLGTATVAAVYAGPTKAWPAAAFSPADVPGLAAWYDAARLTLPDAAPVATWPDRSGYGRDATQTTPTLQPVCVVNGRAGNRIVRFDGVDDYLLTVAAAAWPTTYSFFAVYKANDAVPFKDGICNAGTNPTRQFQIRQQDTAQVWFTVYNTAGGGVTESAAAATQTWHHVSAVRSPAVAEVWADTASDGPTATTGTPAEATVGLYLGTSNFQTLPGNIDLAEVILYSRDVTTTERQQLETYLRTHWALP